MQGQSGEVSYGRLMRQLTGGRPVVRAVAYASARARGGGGSLAASGFEVETVEEGGLPIVALTVDAMSIASKVDCVVLVPDLPTLQPLVRALRGLGVRVETAGFSGQRSQGGPSQGGPSTHQVLGKESLFIP